MLVSGLLASRLWDSGPDGYPHVGSSFSYRPWKACADFRVSRRRSDLSCHHIVRFAIASPSLSISRSPEPEIRAPGGTTRRRSGS